jgi:hypothetical protein
MAIPDFQTLMLVVRRRLRYWHEESLDVVGLLGTQLKLTEPVLFKLAPSRKQTTLATSAKIPDKDFVAPQFQRIEQTWDFSIC